MSVEKQINELVERWASAVLATDAGTLDALATDDFTIVGPLGFVLDKQQWLGAYRSGGLVTHMLITKDLRVRDYGEAAVAIGEHSQKIEFRGDPSGGDFRITHIAVRRGDEWLLAGQHFCQITPPPGA
jgi:ketosteroid isomerase-like protein